MARGRSANVPCLIERKELVLRHVIFERQVGQVTPLFARFQLIDDQDAADAHLVELPDQRAANESRPAGNDDHGSRASLAAAASGGSRPNSTSLARHSSRSRLRLSADQDGSCADKKSCSVAVASSLGCQTLNQAANAIAFQARQEHALLTKVDKRLPDQRKQRLHNPLADRLGVLSNLPLRMIVHPQHAQEVQ